MTNQITPSSTVAYDARGNLTRFGSAYNTKAWDVLDRMTQDKLTNSGTSNYDWQYILSGSDERLVRFNTLYNGYVTRREMARFIVQARGEQPSATACDSSHAPTFSDVPCADPDWGWIQKFYEDAITAGCGGGVFCPDSLVTRAQMSVFLWKGRFAGNPNPCTPPPNQVFADVACPSGFAVDYIEGLYNLGVTAGCGINPLIFCPNNNTTEMNMAAFLSKTAMWPNYHAISGGSTYTIRDDGNRVVTEFADSFPSRDNIYLGNLMVASYSSVVPAPPQSAAWTLYSSDHLGSVRLGINGTGGGTVETHRYWPYGDHWCSSYPCTPVQLQRIGFSAMERDSENTSFYDHARNHDYNLGRFVSPDKVRGRVHTPQTWNRYAYARNNPIKYFDPTGLVEVDLTIRHFIPPPYVYVFPFGTMQGDNRTFSTNSQLSSRTVQHIVVETDPAVCKNPVVQISPGSASSSLNRTTGGTGQASTAQMDINAVRASNGDVIVTASQDVAIPRDATFGIQSPFGIRSSVTIRIDAMGEVIEANVSRSQFPAMEINGRVDGQSFSLFQGPASSTPFGILGNTQSEVLCVKTKQGPQCTWF